MSLILYYFSFNNHHFQTVCPEVCNENGLCAVDVRRSILERKQLKIGDGDKIEYDSYAECNAGKNRCCKKIPAGKFRHDGEEHRCYLGDPKDNIHTCTERCSQWYDCCIHDLSNSFYIGFALYSVDIIVRENTDIMRKQDHSMTVSMVI